MAKVLGLGGIFFRARDPAALAAWYGKHLGLDVDAAFGGVRFDEDTLRPGYTLWSPFAEDTSYFGEASQRYMINFRVDDLATLLAQLRADGVWVDEHTDEGEFGRFGWIRDPEGTRIELWEPPAD